jgi:putative ABC transport system permease protein
VLIHSIWVRRFAGDPGAVGRIVVLNDEPFTVAGVLPASFQSYPAADFYLPLQMDPRSNNQGHYLSGAARLKDGSSIETANAEMKIAAEQFRQSHPGVMNKDESAIAVPFQAR